MDPRRKSKPLSFRLVLFVACTSVCFRLISCDDFDSFTERVTSYLASLMISQNPKSLTFYHDTKLWNVHTVSNCTKLGKRFSMSNRSCFVFKERFFGQILATVRRFQVSLRLLALPGFSTLIECDTYLARYLQYLVGQPSKMSRPRAYRNSISECKIWALHFR